MVFFSTDQHSDNRITSRSLHMCLFIAGLASGFLLTSLFFDRQTTVRLADDLLPSIATSIVTTQNKSLEYPNLTENSTVADRLYNEVRITCFVNTFRGAIQTIAKGAHRNWGHRCNKVVFISSEDDDRLETTVGVVGVYSTWEKAKNTFKYLHKHYSADTDFFVGADHLSFIIPENIRYMVYPYPAELPSYFGSNFKWSPKSLEPSSTDYVISRAALDMIVEFGLTGATSCKGNDSAVAISELYKCMQTLAITEGNSKDGKGLERFLSFAPFDIKLPENMPVGRNSDIWYRKHLFTETMMLNQHCSDFPVSFKGLAPDEVTAVNCLINIIQPYGIVDQFAALPPKFSDKHLAAMSLFTHKKTVQTKIVNVE